MRIKLGIPMSLREIAHILDGILTVKDVRITHLTTDSRSLISGDLFLAIGKANDYLYEAKSRGAYTLSSKAESDIVVEDDKDILLMPEIYFAGGTVTKDISSEDFIKLAISNNKKAHFFPNRKDVKDFIIKNAQQGDRVVIMGARDNTLPEFCREILEEL